MTYLRQGYGGQATTPATASHIRLKHPRLTLGEPYRGLGAVPSPEWWNRVGPGNDSEAMSV